MNNNENIFSSGSVFGCSMLSVPRLRSKLLLALGDFLSIGLTYAVLFYFNPLGLMQTGHETASPSKILFVSSLVSFSHLFFCFLVNLSADKCNSFNLYKTVMVMSVNAFHLFVLTTLLPDFGVRPVGMLIHVLPAIFVLIIWRLVARKTWLSADGRKRIVIIGAGSAGHSILKTLRLDQEHYDVVGFLEDNPKINGKKVNNVKVLGSTSDLLHLANNGRVDSCVVANDGPVSDEVMRILFEFKIMGFHVYDIPGLCEMISCKVDVLHVHTSWFISSKLFGSNRRDSYKSFGKRFFDVVMATVILFFSSPILLLTAMAIKLDSKGPVFYRQVRVGLNKKLFQILKFRSMRTDAEVAGVQWAEEDDPRITRVGDVLRKFRIDEIPQVWNVLKGDMSFIGPRPERPEFELELEQTIPFYTIKHIVKPGITGWAQVSYPYGASIEDSFQKIQYDIFYIMNESLVWDIFIILKTIRVVIFGNGAR